MLVTEVGTGMAGVTALASQVTENEVFEEGVSASDIAYLKTATGKKDLTGYIKYYAVDCVGHYDTKAAKNLKITLTLE